MTIDDVPLYNEPMPLPLRQLRKNAGYRSAEAFATVAGVSKELVNKIERGERSIGNHAKNFANILGVVPEDILEYAEELKDFSALHRSTHQKMSDNVGDSWGGTPKAHQKVKHTAFVPGVPPQFIGKICVVRFVDGKEMIGLVDVASEPGYYLVTELTDPAIPFEGLVRESAMLIN